mmetsp:Transcript_13037/g.24656  ORF Transcript_13037/g.24656 Transcript_13037/m.24656 type:complete len:110 (-) Transcript_13037:220-549(-)
MAGFGDEGWEVVEDPEEVDPCREACVWFMILKSAHLPSSSSWPLGGGICPTNLKPEAHQHRTRWTSFHALLAPEPVRDSDGEMLVGSALVGFPSFPFILDGSEVTVKGA